MICNDNDTPAHLENNSCYNKIHSSFKIDENLVIHACTDLEKTSIKTPTHKEPYWL